MERVGNSGLGDKDWMGPIVEKIWKIVKNTNGAKLHDMSIEMICGMSLDIVKCVQKPKSEVKLQIINMIQEIQIFGENRRIRYLIY